MRAKALIVFMILGSVIVATSASAEVNLNKANLAHAFTDLDKEAAHEYQSFDPSMERPISFRESMEFIKKLNSGETTKFFDKSNSPVRLAIEAEVRRKKAAPLFIGEYDMSGYNPGDSGGGPGTSQQLFQ